MHQVAQNNLRLLKNGAEYFPQLCTDIDAAQHSIYLETYIYAADHAGRLIAEALKCAAARGVVVRLLLDGYGSAELPQQWVDELRAGKVEVLWFRREISPFTFSRSRMRRLRRLHRKLAVVDGEVAFVGGINIMDDVSAQDNFDAPRLDYAVRIQGALAGEIQTATRRLWGVVSWASFRRRGKEVKRFVLEHGIHTAASNVSLLLRDNLRHRRDIEHAYLKAIAGAQHEIIIANAYFLPGRVFRLALIHATRRGVRVELLLQGKVEYRLQHYATHALYSQLLDAGVEIYEYQVSYLHAKVAVVDGRWATVGSSNIDPYSLGLAREANIGVHDAGFAADLRASLLHEMAQNARLVDPVMWRKQGLIIRLLTRISYGLVRVLAGVVGYMRGHDDK